MNRLLKLMSLGIGLLSLGVILLSVGCGTTKAKLRVMNASPDESNLDVLVDSKSVATNVAYGTATSYLSVSSGSRHLQIEPSGTSSALIDQTLDASSGNQYTVFAANFSASIAALVLTDANSAPSSGNIELRIVNASPSLGSADVYVVAPGTDLNTVTPTVSSLGFESATGYQSLTAGSYEVFFTPPGQKFQTIDSGALTLTAGQIRTVVALNSQAGGFIDAVLSDLN